MLVAALLLLGKLHSRECLWFLLKADILDDREGGFGNETWAGFLDHVWLVVGVLLLNIHLYDWDFAL